MSVDLTCECQYEVFVNRDYHGRCMTCQDAGRRQPRLDEWDALVAERDRYRQAVLDIAEHSGAAATASLAEAMARRARAALGDQP